MVESTMYESFDKLSKAMEKGKLIIDLVSEPLNTRFEGESNHLFKKHMQETKIYQFNGITIVEEEHEEEGLRGKKPASNVYVDTPFVNIFRLFYILKNDKLISDEKEVKEIIKDVTGIDLPKLNVGYNRIITEISPDEKHEDVSCFDYQTNEAEEKGIISSLLKE
jgi:hypothetical protein